MDKGQQGRVSALQLKLHGLFDVLVLADFRQQLHLFDEHSTRLPLIGNAFQQVGQFTTCGQPPARLIKAPVCHSQLYLMGGKRLRTCGLLCLLDPQELRLFGALLYFDEKRPQLNDISKPQQQRQTPRQQ
ncbi:hypothetical protein D3C80_1482260 [compost metagenome]